VLVAGCAAGFALLLAAAGARGAVALADSRTAGALWPANRVWLELSAWALALAAAAFSTHLARKRISPADAWTACAIVWACGAIALAFVLPGGSFCLVLPLMAAALVSHVGETRGLRAAPLVLLGTGGALLFQVALDLVVAMGVSVLFVATALVALVALALAPLLLESGLEARVGMLALAISVAGVGVFLATPPWTVGSPRPLNLIQFDGDDGARLVATDFGSGEPPSPLREAGIWASGPIPELTVGFRSGSRSFWSAPVGASGEPGPVATLESWEPRPGNRVRATLRLHSNRVARVVRLRADVALDPAILRVGSHRFDEPSQVGVVTVHTLGASGVDVELELAQRAGATLTLQDETPGLPASSRAIAAKRTPSMSPIHRGDRLVVSRTIPLSPALR
jgi:hypothetical protein